MLAKYFGSILLCIATCLLLGCVDYGNDDKLVDFREQGGVIWWQNAEQVIDISDGGDGGLETALLAGWDSQYVNEAVVRSRKCNKRLLLLLASIKSIRALDFTNCTFDNDAIVQLGKLLALERLVLSGTNINNDNMLKLSGLIALRSLILRDAQIGDEAIPIIAKMKKLEVLNLDGTNVSDTGMSFIGQCNQLKMLTLDGLSITDEGIVKLKNLKRLEAIYLEGTKISDSSVTTLMSLPNLRLVRAQLSEQAIQQLKNAIPLVEVK